MAISPLAVATEGYVGGGAAANTRELTGSSQGIAFCIGSLEVPRDIFLVGSSLGNSNTASILTLYKDTTGSSIGTSSTSSLILDRSRGLEGSTNGASLTSGSIILDMILSGEGLGKAEAIGHIEGGKDKRPASMLIIMKRKVEKF